jgi:integrase
MANKKRGPNDGTITQRKDGRWMARLRAGHDADGKPQRITLYGKTQKEAREKLDDLKRRLREGQVGDLDRQTVGQFLTYWLDHVAKPTVRASTFRSYKYIVEFHLIPALGKYQLTKLTTQRVQALLNAKREAGLAPNTVRTIRAVLRRALNEAVVYRQVAQNVASAAKPPRGGKAESVVLDQAQATAFLYEVREDRLEALYRVAVALGLRQGEILGLRWEDVDFERRLIQVRFQMQRVDGEFAFVELKSRESRRIVDLPEMLVLALKKHKKRQNEERLLAKRWDDRDLVFCTRYGTPLDGPNVTRYFQAALERANLPRLRFHELRHSCASLLIAQGYTADEVRRLLGHSDVRLTLNTYTHQFEASRRRVADAMDAIFPGAAVVAN